MESNSSLTDSIDNLTGDHVYKGRAVEVTSALEGFQLVGTRGQRFTIVSYDKRPIVGEYYKIFRTEAGFRSKHYLAMEHDKEKSKIVSISYPFGITTLEMESGKKYKITGDPRVRVGDLVNIVKIEDEYFVR